MQDVFVVLGRALRLDDALFAQVTTMPLAVMADGIAIALMAGASVMLGHIAILTVNRVRRWRLLSSLLLSAVLLIVLRVVDIVVIWSIASMVLGKPVPLIPLLLVALLATGPQVFSFITAAPYFGMTFGRLLEAWGFLIVVEGIRVAFAVEIWWALGCAIAGWLVVQVLARIGKHPLNWVASRLWSLATGRPTMVTSSDILAGTPIIPVSHPRVDAR